MALEAACKAGDRLEIPEGFQPPTCVLRTDVQRFDEALAWLPVTAWSTLSPRVLKWQQLLIAASMSPLIEEQEAADG